MSQEAILCSHCGVQQLKPDARFCHQCGQPILIAQPAQPTQSPATTPTAPQGVSQLAPSAREDSSQPIFKATSPRQQRAALWLILLVIVMVAAATLAVFFARQRGREEPLTRFGSVPQASARPAQGTEGPVQKTVTMRPSTPVPTPTPAATLSPEDQFTQTARETFGSSCLMEARLRDGYGIDGTGLGGWVKVRSGTEVSASYAFESAPIIVESFKGMAMFVPKVFQQNPKLVEVYFEMDAKYEINRILGDKPPEKVLAFVIRRECAEKADWQEVARGNCKAFFKEPTCRGTNTFIAVDLRVTWMQLMK